MIYLTSDTHFNHDKEFIWGPRGFKSCKESNETIIRNWNNTVKPEDTIIIVGDYILGKDIDAARKIVNMLNGIKILVVGNHDTKAKLKLYEELGIEIVYAMPLEYKGRHFYISHYPTLTADLTSSPDHAIFNLFGHTHSKKMFYEERPYMYNVAVDAHNCTPVSIDQIYNDINDKIKDCISYL